MKKTIIIFALTMGYTIISFANTIFTFADNEIQIQFEVLASNDSPIGTIVTGVVRTDTLKRGVFLNHVTSTDTIVVRISAVFKKSQLMKSVCLGDTVDLVLFKCWKAPQKGDLFFKSHTGKKEEIIEKGPSQNFDFFMTIEDVSSIRGRGTIVTGKVTFGNIKLGDEVIIRTPNKQFKTSITSVEMFRKKLERATEGKNVRLLLRGISKNEVKRYSILYK